MPQAPAVSRAAARSSPLPGWTTFEGASYVASTRTGAYVVATQADGGALGPGPSLVIQDFLGLPTAQAPQYQPSVIRVIGNPAWPACHGT
jgi:hypothetical protein